MGNFKIKRKKEDVGLLNHYLSLEFPFHKETIDSDLELSNEVFVVTYFQQILDQNIFRNSLSFRIFIQDDFSIKFLDNEKEIKRNYP